MDLAWTLASSRLIAAALNVALGAVVLLARPDRRQNRLLAAMLLLNGLIHTGIGLVPIAPDAVTGYALIAPTLLSMILYVGTYLVFTGTLQTPLTRPFQSAWGPRVVLLCGGAMALSLFLARGLWYAPAVSDGEVPHWLGIMESFALHRLLDALIVIHFLYGLVVAVHAYRRAVSASERRKMKWFAIAFGTHDSLLALTFGATFAPFLSATGCASCDVIGFYGLISIAGVALAAGLAYGILTTQLFDIDLRIKATLRQSTVAAAFVAVAFVTSELAASVLSERVGTVLGILAAGALVFMLAPLQAFAHRVADAAMPDVRETPEYVAFRKLEVYKAALEGAFKDGEVTEKEREVLHRLRVKLDVSDADARAIERDLAGSQP